MSKTIHGYVACPTHGCDQIASVLKTSGTRNQYYTRCPECGCDQRNGSRHQKWIADNMRPSHAEIKEPAVAQASAPMPEEPALPPATENTQRPDVTRPARPDTSPGEVTQPVKTSKATRMGVLGFAGMIFGGLVGLCIA